MLDAPNPQSNSGRIPPPTEAFGNVPNDSEAFGNVRNTAETFGNPPNGANAFGTVQHATEAFRTVPPSTEPELAEAHWRESYTLTVREVVRLFEAAGVARSERSIVNWCRPNRQAVSRLAAYFDPNERRYFITRQSVDTVIAEEKARALKANAEPSMPTSAEDFGRVPQRPETNRESAPIGKAQNPGPASEGQLAELRQENLDLRITNKAKDYFIEQLKAERESLIRQVVDASQEVGRLENRLLQLEESRTPAPDTSEGNGPRDS